MASRHVYFNLYLKNLAVAILLLGLAACSQGGPKPGIPSPTQTAQITPIPLPSQVTVTASPTLPPSRLLTICLLHEPRSLFFYSAVSTSEQSVLSAIYDGPIDIKNFIASPIIIQKMPSLADGDALLQSVPVSMSDLIVDARGDLTNLEDGVIYRPSGCNELACAQSYSGTDPVVMDQLVLYFKLLPGLQWSDGTLLTAADSVYSYEVARSLYPAALPEQVNRTSSYKAIDNLTVVWTGVPGFIDAQGQKKFFSPLPQHAWVNILASELSTNEISSRRPLGWGPYVIDEWITGDHISLHANPLYFRVEEGLPHFDHLVYRFVADQSEALSAVLAGECDIVDQSTSLETQTADLLKQRDAGRISLVFQTGFAWELLEFDLSPTEADRPALFASREVRQAVAMCIDRQALVDQLSAGQMQVADLYVPAITPVV